MTSSVDDNLVFTPESAPEPAPLASEAWRILVVDDDEDVHVSTELALKNKPILGRPLHFLHTYSAAQTLELLKREDDIAVILLDVVMENDTAGLTLIHSLREELGMTETRIVLRTGQPGFAPEIQVIRDYDINDYKTKSELTQTRLYTTLTAAIRSYAHIRALASGSRGLDMIARASSELMERHDLQDFAHATITHLAALLDVAAEGVVCAVGATEPPSLIAASGRYTHFANAPLAELAPTAVRKRLEICLADNSTCFEARSLTLTLQVGVGRRIAVYLDTAGATTEFDQYLIKAFGANMAVGFANTELFAQLRGQAYVDPLTQLPNRLHFLHALDAGMRGERNRTTVVLVDIDAFAETNDALGHRFGDHLLQEVAKRLLDALPDATIARIAGDAFGVMGHADRVTPATFAAIFDEPFRVDDQELVISATQGFVRLSEIDGKGVDVLRSANMALKRAKHRHRGEYSFFTREMATETREKVALLHALRTDFDARTLFLMYQPQIELGTGRVVGLEALIRWRSEEGRMIPPDRFIPLAENTGLIIPIGQWVLETACDIQLALARAGYPTLRVAINVSQAQFRQPAFISRLRETLAATGARADCIELEITESMAMEDAAFVTTTLQQLAALGLKVAIDDFGTGFSSLAYLRQFRVDRLKIDKSFTRGLCSDVRGREIPEMIIQLGQRLGLCVIAEGVETPEQAAVLKTLGCQEAQGYLYARPMEADALFDWLRTHAA